MIAPVDRTSELLASMARCDDGSPPKPASRVLPATQPFTLQTVELSRQISAMRRDLSSQRRRYEDFGPRGMSDSARDALDSSIAGFVKGCLAQLDAWKVDAVTDLKRGQGNASYPAFRLGSVAILNEQLQDISRMSEEMRHARIRAAIDARSAPQVKYSAAAARGAAKAARERDAALDGSATRQGASDGAAEMEMYRQEFANENAALVGELIETREQVRGVERTVVEIANLNQLFASKVLEQGREIESLYELAVEATLFVDRGNKELRKMKGKGPMLKIYVGLVVVLLILCMLFLDWIA